MNMRIFLLTLFCTGVLLGAGMLRFAEEQNWVSSPSANFLVDGASFGGAISYCIDHNATIFIGINENTMRASSIICHPKKGIQ